jgi:hypothetical protein
MPETVTTMAIKSGLIAQLIGVGLAPIESTSQLNLRKTFFDRSRHHMRTCWGYVRTRVLGRSLKGGVSLAGHVNDGGASHAVERS